MQTPSVVSTASCPVYCKCIQFAQHVILIPIMVAVAKKKVALHCIEAVHFSFNVQPQFGPDLPIRPGLPLFDIQRLCRRRKELTSRGNLW